ncbi:response regulator [Pseudoalteromonas sp. SG45-5]|uniref:hybrid sensor histidine kinase/response regulator n=1 Tax=unclassified Pseudoalteromonas TaxID=194690 RepID=UPI0015F95A29|nr:MULTISPECIES: hybrid sensor histidine kinase/response regulator [unclassified Pseudoalteromonas]MBB1386762.1 response regulator [Pseudoalteromonas sp. SG45-5]MBB1395637.1 response regulator [Pseudoalteromonas sp. SG44-4]MBB1446486.1 response regulator [Pseudoalteromonas sp. SG41-6]
MQNKFSSPVKGLLPLFLIINIVVSTLAIVAYSFYPSNKNHTEEVVSSIDINKLATRLDLPMVDALTMSGQGKVKQLLDLTSLLDNNFQYTLYRFSASSQTELVYSSVKPAPLPIQLNKYLIEDNILHHVLMLNGQSIGELIIKQDVSGSALSTLDSQIITYVIAFTSVIALFLLALLFNRYVNNRVSKSITLLSNELHTITDTGNYNSNVNEQLDIGLGEIAKNINLLLQKTQTAITSNDDAQVELKKLQNGLDTEVHNRTIALEQASLKAERASETKTTFLATMSHEIRTPMNGVIGTIDLLRQTELDGAQHRLSTIIRESAFSLLSILDDILDFSKIEAGRLNIDPIPFSVTDTIEEVSRVLSSVAKKRELDLELSIAPDIPTNLMGDTVRVRQVLYNLCSNAIKFTSTDDKTQGHVKISVEVAHNTADHFTLRFCVTDNGKGMTQSQLREIFNPFIQAENSITREYGGTGLGLSICKSLTELMLGTIHVTSHIGIGSEFTVELPFSIKGKIQYAHKNALDGKHIVVVSNHLEREKIMYRYLSFMGAKITYAHNEQDIETQLDVRDVIWVVDGIDNMDSINALLRRLLYSLEDNNQQVVVLSKLDEAAINHNNIFYINASPLCKSNFMLSVLVAAGLHKPKKIKKTKTLKSQLNVEQARQANKLILLVEDNLLNQQVLTDQLHILGYGVEVANDGEEGLNMWRKSNYSLILTDLHMPKMSGYDMVEKIRGEAELLEAIDAQPYIIAVTANALKGEKERCLAVGINDFITKPIELNALEDTLSRWSDKQNQSKNEIIHQNIALPIDMEAVEKYINGDKAKQIRFFKMYLDQSQSLIKSINSGVMMNDLNEIIGSCHQLKSISKTIGAEMVADLTTTFEDKCKADELTVDELIGLRDQLEIEYSKAAQFLKEQIKTAEQEDELID